VVADVVDPQRKRNIKKVKVTTSDCAPSSQQQEAWYFYNPRTSLKRNKKQGNITSAVVAPGSQVMQIERIEAQRPAQPCAGPLELPHNPKE
jgi:hypothetical protein